MEAIFLVFRSNFGLIRSYFAAAVLAVVALCLGTTSAWASSDTIPHFIDYYAIILHAYGLDAEQIKAWAPAMGGFVVLVVNIVLGLYFKASLSRRADAAPQGSFSLSTGIEMIMDFVSGIAKENLGSEARTYLPFLTGLFMFVLIGNLSGLVPGFSPPTLGISTNLALGFVVFLVYNYAGIREHGSHYIKQFLGPVAWIAPIVLAIELISHLSRPLSLSLRLMGNIFADHLMLGAFTGITYIVIPAALMFFGLLVCAVQSFVFTLLTSIYISMARSHDH